ncbi:MAG: hypothetical protein PHH37_14770 [Paludibacter sp.]|nr:hypothetical protein [Paludibacter sp.]
MKKFLKNTTLFLLPLIIIIILFFTLFVYINNQSNVFKIEPSISNVYIGDSHIQLAINDSIIPNSINIATSAESFYFSYYKLKMVLDNNPSIDTVYLGLSYHSLSIYYNRFINGDCSAAVAPNYFYLLPLDEQFRMINWNTNNLIPFMLSIIEQSINRVVNKKNYPYIDGFIYRFEKTKANKSSMDKRLHFQYYTNKRVNAFSKLNIDYLDKIIDMCKSKGVVLITLNTPLHEYYYKNTPVKYKEKLRDLINSRGLNYIDLSKIKLDDDCFIPDGDHVSEKGADKTTTLLKDIIKHKHTALYKNNNCDSE